MAKKSGKRGRPYLSSGVDLGVQVTLTAGQIEKDPESGLVRHGKKVRWTIDNQSGSDTVVVIGNFQRLSPQSGAQSVPEWPFKESPPWVVALAPTGRSVIELKVRDKHPDLTGPHCYSYSVGCPGMDADPEIVIEWP